MGMEMFIASLKGVWSCDGEAMNADNLTGMEQGVKLC